MGMESVPNVLMGLEMSPLLAELEVELWNVKLFDSHRRPLFARLLLSRTLLEAESSGWFLCCWLLGRLFLRADTNTLAV